VHGIHSLTSSQRTCHPHHPRSDPACTLLTPKPTRSRGRCEAGRAGNPTAPGTSRGLSRGPRRRWRLLVGRGRAEAAYRPRGAPRLDTRAGRRAQRPHARHAGAPCPCLPGANHARGPAPRARTRPTTPPLRHAPLGPRRRGRRPAPLAPGLHHRRARPHGPRVRGARSRRRRPPLRAPRPRRRGPRGPRPWRAGTGP